MSDQQKRGIILLTHGGWGTALIKSVQMIVGEVNHVVDIPLLPSYTLQDYCYKVEKILAGLSTDSLIIADLFGGTTANVGALLARRYSMTVLTGLSAPLLIEAVIALQHGDEFSTRDLINVSRNACIDVMTQLNVSR